MKAISIKQPWAHSILYLGKDIENRDWYTQFRGTVAIHSSKKIDATEYAIACRLIYHDISADLLEKMPTRIELIGGAILGTVEIYGCVQSHASPWFFGSYGFVLGNPKPLKEPIYCKGALGFWEVPKELEEQFIYA